MLISLIMAEGGVFFRNASGALMLAYVASGRLLGYVEEHMNAWDCLAGMLSDRGGRRHGAEAGSKDGACRAARRSLPAARVSFRSCRRFAWECFRPRA